MTLKIGNVELENNVILAPMAGVTDMPYRILCREQGAGLVCMEMVSAKAILYKNKNTQELLKVDERERRAWRMVHTIFLISTWAARCRRSLRMVKALPS